MTRSTWVTVRLPGASTAPATRTRMRFQTGAVKQGRNTDSHVSRIGGTRCGSGAVVAPGWCDSIVVVESRRQPRRKSRPCLPRHSPTERFILHRHDRSDHSAYRELPVSPRATARRTSQPRLHALSRRRRYADRATASDRTERSCRGALLVAMEGTLDQRRAVWADHPVHRRGPAVHRFRGHLLGRRITAAKKNAESPAEDTIDKLFAPGALVHALDEGP